MSYFNDEQLDHMRDLARLAKEGKVCPCGWYMKEECAQHCNSVYRSPEGEIEARAKRTARGDTP